MTLRYTMRCDECGDNRAEVHITATLVMAGNGSLTMMNQRGLCAGCAIVVTAAKGCGLFKGLPELAEAEANARGVKLDGQPMIFSTMPHAEWCEIMERAAITRNDQGRA